MQEKTLEEEFVEWFYEDPAMELANGVGTPKNIADWWVEKIEKAREEGRKEGIKLNIAGWEAHCKADVNTAITQYKEELLEKISKLEISNCYNDSTIFNHRDYVPLSEVKKLLQL